MFGDAMVDVRDLAVEAVSLCHFLVFKNFLWINLDVKCAAFFLCKSKPPAGM
jgi:hypothetical protein